MEIEGVSIGVNMLFDVTQGEVHNTIILHLTGGQSVTNLSGHGLCLKLFGRFLHGRHWLPPLPLRRALPALRLAAGLALGCSKLRGSRGLGLELLGGFLNNRGRQLPE